VTIIEILTIICLAIGITFNSLGVIGLLRFPDLYTRMHATTKATTFGSVFTTLAVVFYSIGMFLGTSDSQFMVLGIHAAIAALALAFTNAVGSHAIARAAHRSGIKPKPAVVDRLEEAHL
jgi:multicomponent Na+:H+ antiporter subunit G